jgi:hypothetical protein
MSNVDKKYLTVLDFECGEVFQYELNKPLVSFDICPYEEFLGNKGHNIGNIEWMVHNNNKIIKED